MKKVVLFISFIMLIVACNNERKLPNIPSPEAIAYNGVSAKKSFTNKINNVKVERKLIKTGNVTFESDELDATRKNIINLVNQYNGYISNDREYKSNGRISNTLSIRIPSNNFDTLLLEISKGVKKFDNKSVNISDVTEQFIDVQVRLKTKKKLETKYLEILKKAKTVREILDVERELGKLRSDIESTEGRLKYLQNQVSFSTLNITFYKQISASETSFSGKISKAFKKGFENVRNFFLYLIHIWPFIIILFLLFLYLRKRRLRTT